MLGIRHPFTGALYERGDKEGTIVVTDGDRRGVFASDGRWIEGDIREADVHLCGWVAGPLVANHRIGNATGQESHRASG